jgi:apolipoprotein N-acyltransferase
VEVFMAMHYFHCTNGIDLVIDQKGQEIAAVDEMSAQARAVATELMRAVPGYQEWWNWSVHVYDAFGAVDIFDFPADRRRAA